MKRYAIGLDNGGTVIKAALFDTEGRKLCKASRTTPVFTPKPGYTERNMEYLWECNCACVREVVEKSGVAPGDIEGLAVCGHGKGLYLWGKDGKPAYPGIVSTDNRAWSYPLKWKESGVYDTWKMLLCQDIMACQQLSLLAWIKDHEPAVYENVQWIFSVKDYIRFRMTGEAYSEVTDISGSGLMDLKNKRIDSDMLKAFGIGESYDSIPPLKYSSDVCGYLTREAAGQMGLIEGIPVAGGMFDIDACAVAADVTSVKEMCTIAGTWSINEYISESPVLDGTVAMNSLYAIPGFYLIEECSATSAGNLEWFLRNLMDHDPLPEGKNIYDVANGQVEQLKPEDSEVYFLPFLYASNAHPLGKGTFVGLTLYHEKKHMLRAVYEGVVYSHKTHIDKLLLSRKKPEAVRLAGGVVNSRVWVQMFADILELPVETVEGEELGALGCAMAAFIAAGIYKDYNEAAGHMVHVRERIMPDLERSKIYREKYKTYCAVRDALDQVWDRFQV